MKYIIEFDLPDDQNDLDIHIAARQMFSGLLQIDHVIRNQLKHGDPSNDKDTLEKCRQIVNSILPDVE